MSSTGGWLPPWESLSLSQQVAQLVVVRASGHLFDGQIQYPQIEPPAEVLQRWVQQVGVGGVILLGGSAAEVGLRSHQLQDWAPLPLLLAADVEEGVGQWFAGATRFPPPMTLKAVAQRDRSQARQYAEQMGAITAQEAEAIGLNWVLAPVVDVNNNPANPVINIRAWGETPEEVIALTTAFIRGAQSYPVLTTAKHFPGHGDTAIDSHLELPILTHDLPRLQQVELPPFQAAIEAGVDAVMTAHVQLPALDPSAPATLSAPLLSQLLRQHLGFAGLIVTDALVMGAITRRYGATEAPLLALEAGADLLLMPAHPEQTIASICAAVETGRITPDRIQASLERIWQAKQKVCAPAIAGSSSHAWEQVPPPPLRLEALAKPQSIATVTAILKDALHLHRPQPSRLQLSSSPGTLRNLIVLDDVLNCSWLNRTAPAVTLPQAKGYGLQVVDSFTPALAASPQGDDRPTLLQVFIRGNPFRGSAGLTQAAESWFRWLVKTHQLQALMIYGSPYLLDQFLPFLPEDVPYGFSYGQMPAAQAVALEALLGDLANISPSDRRFIL